MEDPEREIAEVARLVIGAADPELQDAAVLKCVRVRLPRFSSLTSHH